ncbi:YceI family protein [Paenibacillus sp. HN-1]|nr:YceI family protein [Paenibacillus sp. CGMCC 1.18879]MBY9084777.1 YceI family protein [Paenibacillus sinensis]
MEEPILKTRKWIWWIAGIAVVAVIIGYMIMERSLGNNVEIESVIPSQSASPSAGGDTTSTGGAAVSEDQFNGQWTIADASKVYWSVTTSRETVNFVDDAVTGSWTVDLNDPSAMKGEGKVDMSGLDSGNGQRDEHVKSDDFLAIGTYPESAFTAASFSELPKEWTEGTSVPVEIKGNLTVKGISKEVVFKSEAAYSGGQLLLSGTTQVTFSDFGMTNPHNVVLETENEFEVRLELVLTKS